MYGEYVCHWMGCIRGGHTQKGETIAHVFQTSSSAFHENPFVSSCLVGLPWLVTDPPYSSSADVGHSVQSNSAKA